MTKIPANVKNFIDQEVHVPKSVPLLPVFEAVHNSLDAISERGDPGEITITVTRQPGQTDGSKGDPFSIEIKDNGVGLNANNARSFNELFSPWKKVRGGKGRGRFTYLKVFEKIDIVSIYEDDGRHYRKHFDFGYDFRGIPEAGSETEEPIGTTVTLSQMRSDYARNVKKDSGLLARDFITHFMPILLADDTLKMVLKDPDSEDLTRLIRTELLIDGNVDEFSIGSCDFKINHVRLRPNRGLHHRLVLSAAGREVDGTALEREIPVLTSEPLGSDPEFVAFGIVQGEYLDRIADPTRLGFKEDWQRSSDEGDDNQVGKADLLGEPSSVSEVKGKALDMVKEHLSQHLMNAVDDRFEAIAQYIRRDGMGYHFLRGQVAAIAERLKTTDERSIENALHHAAYEERRDRNEQVSRLLSASPKEKTQDGYFERWEDIVERLSDVAKSELAGYVAHRKAIIDLVTDLLRSTDEGKHRREEVLHNIIFPIRKQSGEVGEEQQNLWLIDERLTFHEHLFSDVSIKKMTAADSNSTQRPDLAIFETGFASFHDAGTPTSQIILVELKKPARDDVSRDDPVGKALDYVRNIKSGRARTEGNAVIDIDENALTTVYILADWTRDFRQYLDRENFEAFPGEDAQYLYRGKDKIMFIAISFKRLLESARRRNNIFFKRLGLE
ncbi:MAG: ATP-binding protein [Hyphomicrobiaceae bacterium]